MSKLELCTVLSVSRPREGAVDMTLSCSFGQSALPGQFVHIKCGDDMLLRRPISLCDATDDTLRLVIEDVGKGSKWLVDRKAGNVLDILGPLGSFGFPLPEDDTRPILLIGGGVGTAPPLMVAKRSKAPADAVLGFRSAKLVMLDEDFAASCRYSQVCTDDGSFGQHGFVTEVAERRIAKHGYQAIYACGNMSMLRAVAELGRRTGIKTWVSLDERMGCGLGACLVCACKTKDDKYVHVCKAGPVFDAEEVTW